MAICDSRKKMTKKDESIKNVRFLLNFTKQLIAHNSCNNTKIYNKEKKAIR